VQKEGRESSDNKKERIKSTHFEPDRKRRTRQTKGEEGEQGESRKQLIQGNLVASKEVTYTLVEKGEERGDHRKVTCDKAIGKKEGGFWAITSSSYHRTEKSEREGPVEDLYEL